MNARKMMPSSALQVTAYETSLGTDHTRPGTQDLKIVVGHKLELLVTPIQERGPEKPHLSPELESCMTKEFSKLETKGAVTPVLTSQGVCVLNVLVPKKDRPHRPIVDLRQLHKYCIRAEHFKMEGIHLVKDLLHKEDWMVKLDFKDAYFAVPIHQDHRKLLQFHWKGKVYQFNCLPFGLSSAPRVFTKVFNAT